MILDENKFNNQMNNFTKPNNNFNNPNNNINQNNRNFKNIFVQDIKTKSHSDPTNKKDMNERALALLHQRLENGHITLEEFNKQCRKLGKNR